MSDAVLVLMPFANIAYPSISLGILKQALTRNALKARVLYANFLFAERIGMLNYSIICNTIYSLTGEWLFAQSAFPGFKSDDDEYLQSRTDGTQIQDKTLLYIRSLVPAYIENIAAQVLHDQPRIVAVSSMFQQHCAALALLRRIKELAPETITVLGGCNCEGSMGKITHQACPWVDFVVSGEADFVFPELCQKILKQGKQLAEIPPSVLGPVNRETSYPASEPVSLRIENLNAVPVPDYHEYFDALEKSKLNPYIVPSLIIETSRGCWWGQKHPCKFCGLNGKHMGFRVKSPERVLEEISYLSTTYKAKCFQFVDNILDMKFFKNVIPALAEGKEGYAFLVETKSNLNEKQLELLADAGIRWLQPGIESLHDEILKRLNKGNSSWMNIQLLKWAMENNVYLMWNFVYNLPDELDEWYHEMADFLPLLFHLQAPTGYIGIRYDRFSEYYKNADQYGLKLVPLPAYRYIYPFNNAQMQDFSYTFVDTAHTAPQPETRPGLTRFRALLDEWYSYYREVEKNIVQIPQQHPLLIMQTADNAIHITDTRPCAVASQFVLKDMEAAIYRACDAAQTGENLLHIIRTKYKQEAQWEEIASRVDTLAARKLLLLAGNRYLSLAIKKIKTDVVCTTIPGGYLLYEKYVEDMEKQKQKKQQSVPFYKAYKVQTPGKKPD